MKALSVYIMLLLLSTPCVAALNVVSKAGQLSTLIDDTSITSLTIEGDINAVDFEYINGHLRHLETLDLSAATITEYRGEALLTGRTYSPANTLPQYALMGSGIKTITLPHSIKTLAEGSLAATALTRLTVGSSVDSLGRYLCNGCPNLSTVTITGSITTLPQMAFKGCSSLQEVTLPPSLEHIDDGAFSGCTALSSINFPTSLVTIGNDAFYHTGLEKVDLSHNSRLASIGSLAFSSCPQLESVLLPEQTITLGDALFFDSNKLKTFQFPTKATNLAPYMLKGTALEDVTSIMHDHLTTIGRYALYGNGELTLITLPGSITSIDTRALAQMPHLKRLEASALSSEPTLGYEVFLGTASKEVELIVADDLVPTFEATPQWQDFNIVALSEAGVDETVSPTPAVDMKMKRDGNNLLLQSSTAMEMITVYSSDGRLLGRTAANGLNEATVSIYSNSHDIIILSIYFSNGSKTVIKTVP